MIKRLVKFFEKHDKLFQLIFGLIQAITVVVLVIITWCYANSTEKMANIMFRELEIANRPYITITKLSLNESHDSDGYNLNVGFTNKGKVPAKLTGIELGVINPRKPSEFFKKTYIINPGDMFNQNLLNFKKEGIDLKREFFIKFTYNSAENNMTSSDYCLEYILKYTGNLNDKINFVSSDVCK